MKFFAILTLMVVALASAPLRVPSTSLSAQNTWTIDSGHSSVVFKIKHVGTSWFYGMFNSISGSFRLSPEPDADNKIDLLIDAGSIDTRDKKRDQHLLSPDFFDAKQFPDITFKSTSVTPTKAKAQDNAQDVAGTAYQVEGDLTLLGVTKKVSVLVEKTGEGEFYGKRVGYEVTFKIKRSDFGMDFGITQKMLGDEVVLMVAVEGVFDEDK